ncbi:MAG: hypothetical protein LQ346_004397 [Caloplaca aetnensis]|nr:MAG: hypothetical protein LQ346_004397 [Caloplaca aetnensis]
MGSELRAKPLVSGLAMRKAYRTDGQGQIKRRKHTRQSQAVAHGRSQPSETEEDASAHFHISIGWTLKEPIQGRLEEETIGNIAGRMPLSLELRVQMVKVKVGNGIVAIALSTKAVESNGIAGT